MGCRMIRNAAKEDIDSVDRIYEAAHGAEEEGRSSTGWVRNVYPVRQTAVHAWEQGELFVMEDGGQVVAAGILNQVQPPAYAECEWEYEASADEIMVLHTLVVDPGSKGRGYGSSFVRYYEEYALDQGCHFLRIDTQEKNAVARVLYNRLGYREAGIVPCVFNGIEGIRLVCMEKKI